MYDRFTDRARKVMRLAEQEAYRSGRELIGTEHILFGLAKEGFGVAANVLDWLGTDLHKIRIEVEKFCLPGPIVVPRAKMSLTLRAKNLVLYSLEEARALNHKYVGTEHLLLGVIREQEGEAAQVLTNLGIKLEDVRAQLLHILAEPMVAESPRRRGGRPAKEYDLFLPVQYPDGTPVDPDKIATFGLRLHNQFGGVVRYSHHYAETGQIHGVTLKGDVVILRVVAAEDVDAGEFFVQFEKDLKAELRLQEILIVVRDIETL